ncbi:MAG: DUF1697 domain-containing protein [Anaerolineae bacterium]|nr:DUF1697 domain-containing protein [Anaerolineae bacterium]
MPVERMKMADLAAVFERGGVTRVQTLLQSGNGVDFAGTLVSPTPRPFYCSIHNDQLEPKVGFFNRHDWYFYTLKNVFSLSANQLYVDPNWTWTESR